jgi:hypothetical protein
MRKAKMSYGISAAVVGVFALSGFAFAYGLSDADYVYLQTQHFEDSDAPVSNLSPLERTTLHYLINDPRTANDLVARDQKVKELLAEYLSHQLWEKAHPGELWDAQKR